MRHLKEKSSGSHPIKLRRVKLWRLFFLWAPVFGCSEPPARPTRRSEKRRAEGRLGDHFSKGSKCQKKKTPRTDQKPGFRFREKGAHWMIPLSRGSRPGRQSSAGREEGGRSRQPFPTAQHRTRDMPGGEREREREREFKSQRAGSRFGCEPSGRRVAAKDSLLPLVLSLEAKAFSTHHVLLHLQGGTTKKVTVSPVDQYVLHVARRREALPWFR
ncbi:hypothetical protein LY76DRAFT_186502 [Colletotrichum caudatum]|nr:hypothetical protein LY76DRAFT_186502 [Colletotrichum caudatum]